MNSQTRVQLIRSRHPRPGRVWRGLLLYLIFLGIAVVIIWPQIKSQAMIAGTDSGFHMNRFYEAAMQIKHGHFSYFQSVYGFARSGRIVNAFYSPLTAYVGGALLLLSGSWVRFQIVSALLELSLGGWLMARLCMYIRLPRWLAVVLATLYLTSYPVSVWVTLQHFTGWGAVLLPLVIGYGIRMLCQHRVRCLSLALAMTVFIQVHLVSSLLAGVALIPFWLVGVRYTKHPTFLVKDVLRALALTVLLTGNVWGSVVGLFSTNHVIPVFPQRRILVGALGQQNTYLGPVLTLMVAATLVGLVLDWHFADYRLKTVALTGFVFLWAASRWFPWRWINQIAPWITRLIQFPSRLLSVALVLLLLTAGKLVLATRRLPGLSGSRVKIGVVVMVALALVATGQLMDTVHHEVRTFASSQVLNQPLTMVHVMSNSSALRRAYRSPDLGLAIRDVIKATPDYLPTSRPLVNNLAYYRLAPYHNGYVQYDRPVQFQKRLAGHWLTASWVNHSGAARQVTVPLAVYRQTLVRVNGRPLLDPRISRVGAVKIRERPGRNVVQTRWVPDLSMKILLLMTLIAWVGVLGRCFENAKRM